MYSLEKEEFASLCGRRRQAEGLKHKQILVSTWSRCPWCPLGMHFVLRNVCGDCAELPFETADPSRRRHCVVLEATSWADLGTEDITKKPWLTYASVAAHHLSEMQLVNIGTKSRLAWTTVPRPPRAEYNPPIEFTGSIQGAFEFDSGLPYYRSHLYLPRADSHTWDTMDGTGGLERAKRTSSLMNHRRLVAKMPLRIEPCDVLMGWTDRYIMEWEDGRELPRLYGPTLAAQVQSSNIGWEYFQENVPSRDRLHELSAHAYRGLQDFPATVERHDAVGLAASSQ